MLTAISRVITAVVVCPSSVGGSPIIPTRSTPPFFGVCASPGEATSQTASAARTTVGTARSVNGLDRMSDPPCLDSA